MTVIKKRWRLTGSLYVLVTTSRVGSTESRSMNARSPNHKRQNDQPTSILVSDETTWIALVPAAADLKR